MSAFLLDEELAQDLSDATKYTEQWQLPFPEYERLAANLPSPDLPAHYTKVTDGGLAGFMMETSMRIWAQLQTGKVVQLPTSNEDYPEWKTAVVDVLWTNKITKRANTMAPFFSKLQVIEHKSYYYGGQPAFVFPAGTIADFIPARVQDIKFPNGYVSDLDAPRLWYIRRYDRVQLRGVIEAAKKVKGNNGWDIKKLQGIYDSNAFTQRDTKSQTYTEVDKAFLGEKVEFATCYQRGVEAPWITIYPNGNNDDDNVVRRETNYLPDGDIPIAFRYNQQDFVNPQGISQVELAGPSQNVVDLLTSAHTYAEMQAVDPPMKVAGDTINDENLDLESLIMAPGNLMFTGNSDVEWFTPDKGILEQFPATISSYKTNVQNLQGTTDATISGQYSGSTSMSKTPAGVSYQKERTNARDNFHRNNADAFLTRLAKLLINTTIQLTEGADVISISDEQRDKLVAAGYKVPEGAQQIVAEFDELKDGSFEFEVDAGTSKLEDDDATKAAVAEAVNTAIAIPDLDSRLAKEGKKFNLGVLLINYLDKSGLDNIDKIITELAPAEQKMQDDQETYKEEQTTAAIDQLKAQQEQEKLSQQQLKTQAQAATTAGALSPEQRQAPLGQPSQPSEASTNSDDLVAERLRAEGWSDDQINEYLNRQGSV